MEESIVSFFEHWVEEFVRAVEMFTGETPTVSQKAPDDRQIAGWEAKLAEFTWWQQESEAAPSFKVWVGAEEASGAALGGGTEDGNDPKALFQEMLGQANQGSAAVISASFSVPVRLQAGTPEAPAALRPLRLAQISVKFRDGLLPDLIVALEPAAAKALADPDTEDSRKEEAAAEPPPASGLALRPNPPMFDRLMDLQLPLSVVLGQAMLPIRDVLKIASGSVIELDRQVGDYVEVMVHGTVVARGEIVSVKGNYGVRIKEVISRRDRYALKDVA